MSIKKNRSLCYNKKMQFPDTFRKYISGALKKTYHINLELIKNSYLFQRKLYGTKEN